MITSKSILSEANKQWIRNNCSKFTSLEIANYYGVSQQCVSSFCRRQKLKLKKSEANSNTHSLQDDRFFNVDHYYKLETISI